MTMPEESPIKRSHIDTHRDGERSGREAPVTVAGLSSIGRPQSSDKGPDAAAARRYVAPMTTTVNSVITAIDINRPGLSDTKRNLLLFFCQGHRLALGGDALFAEALYATDRGIGIDDLAESTMVEPPSNGALNTISGVLERYGDLSPADLRTLVWASTPWQLAMKSTSGPRIEWAWLRDWFTRPDETDDPHDDRPTKAQLTAWAGRRRT